VQWRAPTQLRAWPTAWAALSSSLLPRLLCCTHTDTWRIARRAATACTHPVGTHTHTPCSGHAAASTR
jgi:hypothetical protein